MIDGIVVTSIGEIFTLVGVDVVDGIVVGVFESFLFVMMIVVEIIAANVTITMQKDTIVHINFLLLVDTHLQQ